MSFKRNVKGFTFQLAPLWTPNTNRNFSHWVWSEKYDGVRAMWDGIGSLISRNGNRFRAPKSFTESLPKGMVLDGELWIDRGMFLDTVSVIRTRDMWTPLVKFMVFDVWSSSLRNIGYIDRVSSLTNIGPFGDHVKIVPSHPLSDSSSNIPDLLESVLKKGGEGLMIRDPYGVYRGGRESASRSSILKVKPFIDEEAEVLKVDLSHGRKGSITVRDTSGCVFKIGSGFKDVRSESPPEVGSIITFGYTARHADSGIPRFPRYIRTRSDFDL